ncbi:MAG: hypothetical protein Ct9H300mP7_3500 [Verrucomicrobiota bacterium]|nr:MAG: hypothetical protein Ct9H300mP7_3500 [Verrucomicrobiota bacterium]
MIIDPGLQGKERLKYQVVIRDPVRGLEQAEVSSNPSPLQFRHGCETPVPSLPSPMYPSLPGHQPLLVADRLQIPPGLARRPSWPSELSRTACGLCGVILRCLGAAKLQNQNEWTKRYRIVVPQGHYGSRTASRFRLSPSAPRTTNACWLSSSANWCTSVQSETVS